MTLASSVLRLEASARDAIHEGQLTSRPLSENYQMVGLRGEHAFAQYFNLPMDWKRRADGDNGVDFVLPLRFTVDVKGFCKPHNLIVEQGKIRADIYVLAAVVGDDCADDELLGWEWGRIVAKAPVKDFGYGVLNHFIPRENLRPMDELLSKVMRLR